jgi:hypothetical protein
MPRTCFVFVFALASLLLLPIRTSAQPNSEQTSQVPGRAPEPPTPPKAIQDSVKAARAKAKKAKTPPADTGRAGAASAAPKAGGPAAPAPLSPANGSAGKASAPASAGSAPAGRADSARASVPAGAAETSRAPAPPVRSDSARTPAASAAPAARDTAKAAAAPDSAKTPADVLETKVEPKRIPPDLRLMNDPPLIGREYGFGILGSAVAGTLGFFIGSGLETAIVGESRAHKGTLSFTGIRYDDFKGAFWGGSVGMVVGSALTIYFTGQTQEEDGGLFATLAGTTAAAAGAFYLASLMGVNDDVDWKPFMPLLVIPSLGGTLGFNVSRWFHDREREEVVGKEAGLRLHAPTVAWGMGPRGERVEIQGLRLTF